MLILHNSSRPTTPIEQCRLDYKHCYVGHRQQPTQQTLALYIDSHNAYVQQLHTTNAMLEAYHCETIPQLLQELEEVYTDLCAIVSEAIFNGADVISSKVSIYTIHIHIMCCCHLFYYPLLLLLAYLMGSDSVCR